MCVWCVCKWMGTSVWGMKVGVYVSVHVVCICLWGAGVARMV